MTKQSPLQEIQQTPSHKEKIPKNLNYLDKFEKPDLNKTTKLDDASDKEKIIKKDITTPEKKPEQQNKEKETNNADILPPIDPNENEWSPKGIWHKIQRTEWWKKMIAGLGIGSATNTLGDALIEGETDTKGWGFERVSKVFFAGVNFVKSIFSTKEKKQEEQQTKKTQTQKEAPKDILKNLPSELQVAIASVKNPKRKKFLTNISKDLHINEKDDASKITSFHKNALGKDFKDSYTEKTSWCMSWALTKMKEIGELKDKFSFYSKHALQWGEKVKSPTAGDLVIVERITKSGEKMGHIGIFLKYASNGNPILISGNIGNKITIHTENRKILGFRNILGNT